MTSHLRIVLISYDRAIVVERPSWLRRLLGHRDSERHVWRCPMLCWYYVVGERRCCVRVTDALQLAVASRAWCEVWDRLQQSPRPVTREQECAR